MGIMHYIGGPLVGSVIGYFTNYIAVKMLFFPVKEVKVGRFTLPFTPGIIPKRKNALAGTVGKAVGDALLTREDLTQMLLSEEVENSVVNLCAGSLERYFSGEGTVGTAVLKLTGEESYRRGKASAKKIISEKIMKAIVDMQPGELIAEEGKKAVRHKLEGNMLGRLVSDRMLNSIAGEIGAYAQTYIVENGPLLVEEQLEKEISSIEEKPLREIGAGLALERERLEEKVRMGYRAGAEKFASSIAEEFHIAEIVEDKICAMDVVELERLVLSVMKHELSMIVNLGAVIGFLLGILNLFF